MNVFLKALLTGKITPTSKLETKMQLMPDKVARYHRVEQSKELEEFEKLSAFIKSDEFLGNQKKQARFKQLEKNSRVKLYFKLKNNAKLQEFLKWSQNDEEYAKLADKEAVKNDSVLRQMKKIDASNNLQTWHGLEKSQEVAEYFRLKEEIVDYSAEIKHHEELSKNEDLLFFYKTDKKQIQRYDSAEKIFDEDFNLSQISKTGWKGGFAYPSNFQSVHSYTNEKQAYMGGENVEVQDGVLYIRTKKEKKKAAAWDEKKGMVMKDFEYTSDVIHNTQAFEEGIVLQIKARCRGFLNHGVYLRSEKHVPFISLFNYTDRAVYCGLKGSIKDNDYKHEIKGLQPIPFSIYTLVWGKDEIIWYLNDMEIHRTKNIIPAGEKLYLHLYSFQFKNKTASEGSLEVDWIRAYKM